MALTTRELFERTRHKFHLQVLAGHDYLDHVVTWVHMTEYASIAEFFWGNEMVVTSGYAARDEASLLRLVDMLLPKRCTGLVVNLGPYIHQLPQSVIDRCEENGLPLLTMPWEVYITEFVRECCYLIDKSTQDEEDLAKAVIHVILSPNEAGADQTRLEDFFQAGAGFQMLVLRAQLSGGAQSVIDQRSTLRLHTALSHFDFPYLVFRYEKRFVILLNRADYAVADEAAQRILESIHASLPELPVQIGIGDPVPSIDQFSAGYHSAISAQRRASLQHQEIVRFREMGFYKLLYSVPDDSMLRGYYEDLLGPLIEHDQRHGTAYVETLFRYLLNDGSLQAVANAMFTHRNTVNYRMGKIRELLNQPLDTQQQRLPYLIAYHAAVILKLTEDFER